MYLNTDRPVTTVFGEYLMKILRLQNTFPNLAFCTYYILSRAGKNFDLLGKVLMFLGF